MSPAQPPAQPDARSEGQSEGQPDSQSDRQFRARSGDGRRGEFEGGDPPERVVGLPPRPIDLWREPTPRQLVFARLLNIFGLVSPVANLGMLEVSRPELRWGGVVAGILLWLAGGVAKAADYETIMRIAFGCHYALVVAGLLHPRWPEAALRAWTRFGELLGTVMSVPIFSAMYLVAVTPVALIMRALGKDPLRRKAPPEASYWRKRESLPKERFHRQF